MAATAEPDSLPLKGVVLCCTSLQQDARTELAEVAKQMGAVHKLDLTSDVTHLLVGNTATPKYRYVAKERPDISVLHPEFIEAVRQAWMTGEPFDVSALEKKHRVPCFWGLQISSTGVDDADERKSMEDMIVAHGGEYNGDLTKTVTHLLAARTYGKKYEYAKQWGIRLVGMRWYRDSLTRGMALDEDLYMPELPTEQQGIGAFRTVPKQSVLAKRARETDASEAHEEGGRRKMRKVASMRLDGQSQELWQSLSASEVQVDTTEMDAWNNESQTLRDSISTKPKETETTASRKSVDAERPDSRQGLFSGHYVLIHGFDPARAKKLRQFLEPNGATIVQSAKELERASENLFFQTRCLLVPHSVPTELPDTPPGTVVVTEWWVERCIHYKQNLDPGLDSLSQPLADSRVNGFSEMRISTTGFTGVDLRQTAEAVKLMGASYQEKLIPTTSVLVCANGVVKKEKAYYAGKYSIPVVSAKWLWDSLRARRAASMESYRVQLPAFDPSEIIGEPSTSSPAASSNIPLRQSGNDARRADEYAQPKRLSSTRRRLATPSLLLKAPKPAPAEESRRKPPNRTGPFIEEENEDDEPAVSADPTLPEPASYMDSLAPAPISQPLRELSPNTSQPKNRQASQEGTHDPNAEYTKQNENAALISPRKSPQRSPAKQNQAEQQVTTNQRLPSELAGLLRRATSTTNAELHTSDPSKRKNRPLGRNLSTTSNHSASPLLPSEIPDSASPADGFNFGTNEEPEAPVGTQLGYEAPDAEAHRRQMSLKMGKTMFDDPKKAKSLGVVKDSEEIAGRKAKAAGSGAKGKGLRRR